MAVLVRVKRKRDELPSERLILAAPRAKRERSAREMLRSTFQGLGLTQPPPAPEQNLPLNEGASGGSIPWTRPRRATWKRELEAKRPKGCSGRLLD